MKEGEKTGSIRSQFLESMLVSIVQTFRYPASRKSNSTAEAVRIDSFLRGNPFQLRHSITNNTHRFFQNFTKPIPGKK